MLTKKNCTYSVIGDTSLLKVLVEYHYVARMSIIEVKLGRGQKNVEVVLVS